MCDLFSHVTFKKTRSSFWVATSWARAIFFLISRATLHCTLKSGAHMFLGAAVRFFNNGMSLIGSRVRGRVK